MNSPVNIMNYNKENISNIKLKYILDWILSSCTATSLEISGKYSFPKSWPKWLSISWVFKANEEKFVGIDDVVGTLFLIVLTLIFLESASKLVYSPWIFCFMWWWDVGSINISSNACALGIPISICARWISFLGVDGKEHSWWWIEISEFTSVM